MVKEVKELKETEIQLCYNREDATSGKLYMEADKFQKLIEINQKKQEDMMKKVIDYDQLIYGIKVKQEKEKMV